MLLTKNMSKDINDDLLPRNVPKPPPLIEAVPKPSVPEVSLLFDQGKGNTVLPRPNPLKDWTSVPRSSREFNRTEVYDQNKSNTVFSHSLPTAARSEEISNIRCTEKEDIPVINRQTESYNVWRSRNANSILGLKRQVGQGLESFVPSNHNYHIKAKETSDVNVIPVGSSQSRNVYSGHPSYRREEVNETTPLDYSNRGHYTIYGSKEPLSIINTDYVTQLNKCNNVSIPNSAYNDTYLPQNEHTSLYPAPEPNPYVNPLKQYAVTAPGNKCDTKYYRTTSVDTPYEELVQRREPCDHSRRKATLITTQDIRRYNNDHMFTQNQCKSGCHDCVHNVSQNNVCCNIPPECTSPNSWNSHRQELGHGCHRNFNHTHIRNSCPSIQNQSYANDNIHSILTDLCNTVKLQTEQIVLLQKQVKQLLQLQIDSHTCASCSVPLTKTSEIFPIGNSYRHETNVGMKQQNRIQSSDKALKNLPVIEENEQSTEKATVSTGVMANFQDSTNTKDASDDSHCNCSSKKKSLSKEVVLIPSQKRPAYYEEPPQHDKEIQPKLTKPVHNMKTLRKSHEKTHENKQKSKTVEESFTLNEADLAIDTIVEQTPSPDLSIHVDMTEYKSDSSDTGSESDYSDSSSNDGKPAEPEIGWTFYNNVVGQVNKILKKKETPPIDEDVKRATIDYLHQIGISFSEDMDNNVSKRVTFNAAGNSDRDGPSDSSHQMNGQPHKLQDFMMYNVASGNTNLSFATLRYLERHQLLKQGQYAHYEPGGRDSRKKKSKKTKKKSNDHQQHIIAKKKSSKPNKTSSKILDVEALKQQPKLL